MRSAHSASASATANVVMRVGVFAGALALLAIFLIAGFRAQWYDELVRRATRRIRPDLRPGYGIFSGIARSTEGVEGEVIVQATRFETRDETGQVVDASETSVNAQPFLLITEGGDEIDVTPDKPDLGAFRADSGFNLEVQRHGQKNGRPRHQVIARVRDGDHVWITGVLETPKRTGRGVYREPGLRPKLTPRKGERMAISRNLPAERLRRRALAHRVGAGAAAGALVVLCAPLLRHDTSILEASSPLPGWSLFLALGLPMAVAAIWRRWVKIVHAR
jgi:hypothetical protein